MEINELNYTWDELGDLTWDQLEKMTKEEIDEYIKNIKKNK